jgi:hypothetical protein
MDENSEAGLCEKYRVVKADTGELVTGCFVLRPEIDPAAQMALLEYARYTPNEELADDLMAWEERIESKR